MSETAPKTSSVGIRGSQPSLIQEFGIIGLYGYKSVSLTTSYSASILIAKNGSGKTTLLAVMDAFLRTQFTRLRGLQFSSIQCKLKGAKEIVLSHDDLIAFLEVPSDEEFSRLARQIEVDLAALFSFLVEEWPEIRNDHSLARDNKIFSEVQRISEYRYVEAAQKCDRLREALFNRDANIRSTYDILSAILADTEIVYLPTYRRIELALPEEKERRPSRRSRPKIKVATGGLYVGEIQFGLSDISARLSELSQKILIQSNSGYRELSANIINELIDGSFQTDQTVVPTREELSLFFSRLRDFERVGPSYYQYPVKSPDLDKIYALDQSESQEHKFLRFFLSKLTPVIQATHDVELQVETFITHCNRYLTSGDQSADVQSAGDPVQCDEDDKQLCFNKRDLRVYVENIATKRKVPLDALSSGEKQMVSLFARMFLYPKNKIVLIDEPELSLSIDWQRQILVDVLDAPLCTQVVAITHSPFVFDNELEPYARSLTVRISQQLPDNLPDDAEEL